MISKLTTGKKNNNFSKPDTNEKLFMKRTRRCPNHIASNPLLIKAYKFHSKRRFVELRLLSQTNWETRLLFISALLINQLSGIQQQSIKLQLGNVLITLINRKLLGPQRNFGD